MLTFMDSDDRHLDWTPTASDPEYLRHVWWRQVRHCDQKLPAQLGVIVFVNEGGEK
jgi:hypothetical protein